MLNSAEIGLFTAIWLVSLAKFCFVVVTLWIQYKISQAALLVRLHVKMLFHSIRVRNLCGEARDSSLLWPPFRHGRCLFLCVVRKSALVPEITSTISLSYVHFVSVFSRCSSRGRSVSLLTKRVMIQGVLNKVTRASVTVMTRWR
eukprot:TRINITY_DN12478_c0_g1_i1.p1 TRINITY_DN12478_c0_g1~~TRINITY_DN12478_c0_g1_i1.p1  ORF type:complete len:145 (-),score=0.55 TRINITY_DN12478_c0_g1_i1:68-502(-)